MTSRQIQPILITAELLADLGCAAQEDCEFTLFIHRHELRFRPSEDLASAQRGIWQLRVGNNAPWQAVYELRDCFSAIAREARTRGKDSAKRKLRRFLGLET